MHERTTDTTGTAVPLPEPPGRSYTPEEGERGRAMTSTDAGRLAGRSAVSREPLGRAERLHLAVLAGVFVLLAAVFGAGAAAYTALSGQLLDMQNETSARLLDMQNETSAGLLDMQKQIGGLRAEMHEEIGKLSDRMDRLAERMDGLSERMTRVETVIETHLVPASNVRDPAGP